MRMATIYKMILLISLVTLNGKSQLSNGNSEKSTTITCQIDDIDFWKLYNWHFGNATSVNVGLFLRTRSDYVQRYLSSVLQYLYGQSRYKRSIRISSYNIHLTRKASDDDVAYDDVNFVSNLDQSLDPSEVFVFSSYEEFYYLQKLRRYAGNPEHAFLSITWDVEDLYDFLQVTSTSMIDNPRGSHMIVFVSPADQSDEDLENILRIIWERYGILNMYIKMPCSSRSKQAFSFSPFQLNDGKWGVLRSFTIDEALTNSRQFRHNIRNFHGYPIAVSMFVRTPSAVLGLPKAIKESSAYNVLSRSGGFGGVDGMVLAMIADYLNFTVTIVVPPTCDIDYGFVAPNGTIVGSLGDVVNHKVAASFNGRFISMYGTDGYEFTTPVSNDLLCILVPKAEKIPQWLITFHCFTLEAWISIVGLYVILSMYWYVVKHINITGYQINNHGQHCADAFFDVLTLFISIPFRNISLNNQRIFIAFCMVFNIIFVSCFQGSLYTSYRKTLHFRDMDTLEQLDESGIQMVTSSKSILEVFGNDTKPVLERLKKKIHVYKVSSMDVAANSRNIAVFERKNDAKMRVKTEYTRKSDGIELLHVMRECPWTYYVSYIVPRGSPYLPTFDMLITTFREAGLIGKWSLDTTDAFILEKRVPPTSDQLKPFTLTDMQTAFFLLAIGLVITMLVFLVECMLYKYRNGKPL